MQEALQSILHIIEASPQRLVLSAPRPGAPHRRGTITPLPQSRWQAELFTDKQAFHQNFDAAELPHRLQSWLAETFTQLTAVAGNTEYSLKVTKKGKILTHSRRLPQSGGAGGQSTPATHNRAKNRLLPEGVAIPPLVDIGIMTEGGAVVAAMTDKYRQINRFVELVDDEISSKYIHGDSIHIVDFGCGKSYLSFVLYYYLTTVKGLNVTLTGLDLKSDVVAHCNAAAQKYGYGGLRFQVGDIADYNAQTPVDMVVTLHACDTATDLALAKAVGWGAGLVFSVPCCQHELNTQLHSEPLHLLERYGLIKERTAALMTDAIRANLLAACGYKTQLVEFVGFEHTPKNIMIRGVKTARPLKARQALLDEVLRLCEAFALNPRLLSELENIGALHDIKY